MTGQPNRLAATTPHQFSGSLIDRSKPLKFRLDGRIIEAFVGDSVLSAALAAGIDTAGQRGGRPLALSARFAPSIIPVRHPGDTLRALPMARVSVTEGADYLTVAGPAQRHGLLGRILRPARSLGLKLDGGQSLVQPWLDSPIEAELEYDLVVVGGGVTGMAAALAGNKAGLSVMLLEATSLLGGHSRLFGTQDGEETPDQSIERLSSAVTKAGIAVQLCAEVTAQRPGLLRVHIVDAAQGRAVLIHAPRIILATGAVERLPIFPGNRLPGVMGALEAFELASRYGVWPGQTALIATASNPAYRLAMLASDAGVSVTRILDTRPQPQSRFIEFAKAYGITMAPGLVPASAQPAKGRGITLASHLSAGRQTRPDAQVTGDRLIVCGGWQPDLTLWHMAGGHSRWNAQTHRLEPLDGPTGVALAGSAAGYFSRHAAVDSGADAVNMLLGRDRKPVHDVVIDPIHETPDAPCPISPLMPEAGPPAMLDSGLRLLERPHAPSKGRLSWRKKPRLWSLADTPQSLDIAAIAAGVQLDVIPADRAGIVAQERVGMVVIGTNSTPPPQPVTPPLVPAFLAARFGSDAELWLVAPVEPRMLDPGSLIHRSSSDHDPRHAVGVILRTSDKGAIALMARQAPQTLSLRDHGRAIPIRLVAPYMEDVRLPQ
ncbi:Sarcosine oxidase alpha subunit [Devosia sp. LC5]|uniref:FAD-dependent oxidoreductase n=1 Tax=Devosia sp. LC5 TaxID=1502724 RepID=UPI0004E3B968|nr:FAD-dependent oxidoreductase [Devosia sp. LC5]KFC71164.1 Sarcosine oxidase alpha subunit [Devosia sp. LC5]